MQYIIYGTDTQTVLGLDEAVILLLPDEVNTADDEFEDWLELHYYNLTQRQIAPLEDVYESLALAMGAEGIPVETVASIITTLNDAIANHVYG